MVNKKCLKSLIFTFGVFLIVFGLVSCAKPLDESALAEETKKIVKKTTNLNRGEDAVLDGDNNVNSNDNAIGSNLRGVGSLDVSPKNANPIEESLNESFSRKFSEWEETYEAGMSVVEEYEYATDSQVKENTENDNVALSGANVAKGAVALRVNKPKIDKSFGVTTAAGGWKYGITPIIWKYVAPNTKLISNTKPNSSETFGNRVCATSGENGCFIPCFSKNVPEGENWTGAMCCFEELKEDPYNYTFELGLRELRYKDIPIAELLEKNSDVTEVTIGLWTLNGEYINIIYCDELDEIINKYY